MSLTEIVHFPHMVDPGQYPDYERRSVRVPTWKTFKDETQFMALRGFGEKDGKAVDYEAALDEYTKTYRLGDIVWPFFSIVFTQNVRDVVEEIKRRGLYMFDIWGHVPGSGTEATWGHVMPPEGMVAYLEETLGECFLGFDNGEQDGRYIGGYARQQCPAYGDRFRQYVNFQRHFERMCDDLGNNMSTLVSLCFGHYFLKEGNHQLIGAETAQALPNSQVYYSFIRGAGKQYGVLWFGNASVFNRWGWKDYSHVGEDGHYKCGPDKGTSLVLLRRLIYSHILYNSVAVGFESGWIIEKDGKKELTAIGDIQAEAVRFCERNGSPGVMHAPVALMLDHFSGWAMPRHLYTDRVYQVWGAMPYDPGDYLTHAVISQLYPGYGEASYHEDERGFLSPTPYGDIADCILSDAPGWTLDRYGVVVLAGRLGEGGATAETRDNLTGFVERGGHLVVTAGNLPAVCPEWTVDGEVALPAGTEVKLASGDIVVEENEFTAFRVKLPKSVDVIASAGDVPLAVRLKMGDGAITVLLSPWGLNEKPVVSGAITNEPHEELECPFGLLRHARRVLDEVLVSQRLFSMDDRLAHVVCRRGPGEYTLGVFNNELEGLPLAITSHCGAVEEIEELAIETVPHDIVGYWPANRVPENAGVSTETTIEAGDVRVFRVRVKEEGLRLRPEPTPADRPANRILTIGECPDGEIKLAILRYPTFFQHFDGVKVDWRYLARRSADQLTAERGWLDRQKIRLIVDLSSGMNFYPGLTLLDTLQFRYDETVAALDDVLAKAEALGVKDMVFSLHRKPENHCDDDRADDRFLAGVKAFCGRAEAHGVTLHLQPHPEKWFGDVKRTAEFVDKVGAANLRVAINTGHLAMRQDESLADAIAAAGERLGMVLLCAPAKDLFGQTYDAHLPLSDGDVDIAPLTAIGGQATLVLDATYRDWDAVYADLALLPKEGGR